MSDHPQLSAQDARIGYRNRVICDGLSVTIPPGRFTVIIGPNACGKSTLLRALARLNRPAAGAVYLDGSDIGALPSRAVARRLSLLPQSALAPEGITVLDLVSRGRFPHQGMLRRWTQADDAAVERAMAATGVLDLARRPVAELSGGQRQRVWIAMVLAQDTPLMLLDEPTTFLDIAHQIELMELLCDFNRDDGRTLVAVLHDLNQAARYADHIIAMREGRILAEGPPAEVMTAALVEAVFDLPCATLTDPVSGRPIIVPLGRRAAPA